ncbi:hypothetical protein vseg_014262 [Gypsophila vaccaria]
MTESRGDR